MVISKDEYYIEQFGFLYIRIFFKRLIRNILLLREGKLIYSLLASSSGHFNSEKKKKKKSGMISQRTNQMIQSKKEFTSQHLKG